MVIHESFVTRKPFKFTLIVLVIVLIILVPIYLYATQKEEIKVEEELIAETFEEVKYLFGPESDLSESDKRHLFELKYEGNFVEWEGALLACDAMTGFFRVSVDQTGDKFGDVLFTTQQNCTNIAAGSAISYRMKLIEWKVTTFTGSEGEILEWGSAE